MLSPNVGATEETHSTKRFGRHTAVVMHRTMRFAASAPNEHRATVRSVLAAISRRPHGRSADPCFIGMIDADSTPFGA